MAGLANVVDVEVPRESLEDIFLLHSCVSSDREMANINTYAVADGIGARL